MGKDADRFNAVLDWLETVIDDNPQLEDRIEDLVDEAFVAFCETNDTEQAIERLRQEI